MLTALLAALLQTAATPAPAVCTTTTPPPTGLEAWGKPVALGGMAGLTVGTATDLSLSDKVSLPVPPGRPPAAGTFAQVSTFRIATPGTYRIALSAGAWIDVIDSAGASLRSAAHTEGPACSGIRKIVDFTLAAGSYTLQLSGAKGPTMRVLVTPK